MASESVVDAEAIGLDGLQANKTYNKVKSSFFVFDTVTRLKRNTKLL